MCRQRHVFSTILLSTNNKYRLLSTKDVSHVSEVIINLRLLFTLLSLSHSLLQVSSYTVKAQMLWLAVNILMCELA